MTTITNPRWVDASHTQIDAECDGFPMRFNAVEGLLLYDEVVASGVDIAEPSPPTPPWFTVTPRQARLALLGAGLLDKVEAAVNGAGGAAENTWGYATIINPADALLGA